ncbi:acyl-CoA reductase [Aliiglaciecola sp. 2_MG-2023]|uniref:acyl-CoA reductase n=1 Tax=unclassified Aliiglaciecola TaxID=2593648 RepID=UPI0026E48570|nr:MULTISPECIES: acyl-CoA reductase [unclassified Aliiglaciecola]MDO6709361.1 acyl-CoA reductase [Aliiglaciecola sp. 2_MG-2023]MDO6750509.1 acyl-CoA reductase [Aliiglaciecola sp. 1_MG-2023]
MMSPLNMLAPVNGSLDVINDNTPYFRCFDENVLAFIESLSNELLKNSEAKTYPELVALGFWLRKSNLKKMQSLSPTGVIKPLGWVVHFTPSNVDTMFIYSWICSLLMGNHNVIRVATKSSDIKDCLLNILNLLFAKPEFVQIGQHNLFVHYDKHSAYSAELSLICDVRVIWGGDDSVNAIRNLPCKPRCRDISFADRYSACVINGQQLTTENIPQLAESLWQDTQPHGQLACSSPRLIYWLGDSILQLELFRQLNQVAKQSGHKINSLNDHLVTSQLLKSTTKADAPIIQSAIGVIPVTEFDENWLDWHLGGGYFLLLPINSLEDIALLSSNKLQTLSYWGLEQDALIKFAQNPSIQGIDRVVPAGRALNFSSRWDGYNLFEQLSRSVEFS